jgi:EXS family
MVPLVISIPSLIRLRQCLIEFSRAQKYPRASSGWGGQHLANALKYATAFPVIILSALQRGYDPATVLLSEASLFRLWYTTRTRHLYLY